MGTGFAWAAKRLACLAVGAALLSTMGAGGALAFCFSNDSLSTGAFEVRQVTRNVDKAKKIFNKCLGKPSAECLGNAFWEGGKTVAKELGWEAIGRGSFSQTVKPDQTKCCSWKDKGCNRAGKKDAKIVLLIQKKKYRNEKRNVKIQGLKTGLKYNAKVGEVEWGAVVEISATDHMECRFDTISYGCKNYQFPESPFRAHKHTSRHMLIKSLHSGKCLDVWDKNKKNGADVRLSNCHGGKNQRWTIYRNGTIRSELNWKCLDVAGAAKGGKNGQNVTLWDCHGAPNQRWTYGAGDKIVSRAPGRYNWCLDIAGGSKKHGANAQIRKCENVGQHRWRSVKK